MKIDIAAGRIKPAKFTAYRQTLQQVQEMAARPANANNQARRELQQIANWLAERWSGEAMDLLKQ
jgi:hypothetical protein